MDPSKIDGFPHRDVASESTSRETSKANVVVAACVILLHVSTRLAHTSSYAYTNTNTYDINMHMRIARIRDLAACEDTCILLLLL